MKWNNGLDLSQARKELEAAAMRATERITDEVFEESQRLVPDDPGTGGQDLRRSGRTRVTEEGSEIVGAIGYGTKYAVIQHERMDYRHRGGQTAKYLERPIGEHEQRGRQILAEETRKAMG